MKAAKDETLYEVRCFVVFETDWLRDFCLWIDITPPRQTKQNKKTPPQTKQKQAASMNKYTLV